LRNVQHIHLVSAVARRFHTSRDREQRPLRKDISGSKEAETYEPRAIAAYFSVVRQGFLAPGRLSIFWFAQRAAVEILSASSPLTRRLSPYVGRFFFFRG